MKTVAFYISDYGYGHASRSIALIRELFYQYKGELTVIVCHSFATDFLRGSLSGLNVSYREIQTDFGYVLENNSMYPDPNKLKQQYLLFINQWQSKLDEEYNFLHNNRIDLVVSDISPLPFIPTSKLGIPSIGVSNFTWYTAYNGLIDDYHLITFQNAYEKMSYFFALASSNEKNWGNKGKYQFGFLSRPSREREVNDILKRISPNKDKTVVYFGLGMKIDIEALNQMCLWNSMDCVFLVSNNVQVTRENVFKIPREYTESQNYIAASDLVITKAGWSTVSEAVIHRKPLIVLDRSVMNEDSNTSEFLASMNRVKLVNWDELLMLKVDSKLLEELSEQSAIHFDNDVFKIASKILEILKYVR